MKKVEPDVRYIGEILEGLIDKDILRDIIKSAEFDMAPILEAQIFDPINLWSVQNDV
jgi:hypothetical protein